MALDINGVFIFSIYRFSEAIFNEFQIQSRLLVATGVGRDRTACQGCQKELIARRTNTYLFTRAKKPLRSPARYISKTDLRYI